ncbi:MYB-like transcription factor TCL2 isoform X2 [Arabidopsis lyrata subsp. lyrata]|uniref:MYB-like transcription factor TCL2 isoform X2 n=1 Tax=Arabidopsis lyrata subsp. lyrata TaxID=81972 RepID=UPI000A29A66A|nr:MYB-like transcription factor TCL2 isoform X2 [Arabidopsis lyrata subsp. lyrata]|eukprot:XP_020885156.1 MYB-like transcription factor TCL2 isoform X2 [Arabidopsis lyrata subsp. lyrata]
MDNTNRLRPLRSPKQTKFTLRYSEEVSSVKWEFTNMTEQEEDLIFRMHRLVGDSRKSGRTRGKRHREILDYEKL